MNTSLYIETEDASKTTGPGITHYNSEFLCISSNVNYFFPPRSVHMMFTIIWKCLLTVKPGWELEEMLENYKPAHVTDMPFKFNN